MTARHPEAAAMDAPMAGPPPLAAPGSALVTLAPGKGVRGQVAGESATRRINSIILNLHGGQKLN